jgi:acetyl-CoA carboxylase biotin carboxyl carrier protein
MQSKKHEVPAPITGTIWKITTTVGAQIGETDTVVIMESMKMEMPVEAGYDGEVVEILIKEGQPVNEGQPLVRLHIK